MGLNAAMLAVLVSRRSLRKRVLVERLALAVLLGLVASEELRSPRTATTVAMIHKHRLTGEKLNIVRRLPHSYEDSDVVVD